MKKKKFKAIEDTYTKFMFVREPMERLASCYNDKMIVNRSPMLVNWRKHVLQKANFIRGGQKNSSKTQVSFDDFLIAVVIPGDSSNYRG